MQNNNANQQLRQKASCTAHMYLASKIIRLSTSDFFEYAKDQIISNPFFEIGESGKFSEPVLAGQNNSPTLQQHLEEQLRIQKISGQRIAKFIIASLDENGYLHESIEEISAMLSAGKKNVRQALRCVQKLEPYGVGARNLAECLIIQLLQKGYLNNKLLVFAYRHLKDVAAGNYKHIQSALGINRNQISQYLSVLRSLNPKPGSAFQDSAPTKYIIPELIQREDGEIELNEAVYAFPKITCDYAGKFLDETAKAFVSKQLNAAEMLLRCIEQRKRTVLKIAQYICKAQAGFFERKILRSLTMQDVADAVGIHVSTVCRAVHEKYMQTKSGGLLPLKQLLSSKRGVLSRFEVLARLRLLIEQENKKAPFSDSELQRILKREDVLVTRRTISNMRNELGIPAVSARANDIL